MLKDGEKLENLGNGISVIVSDMHHFFTDTILLADFANPKKNEKAVDLGSGCGTIPLLWSRYNTPLHTTAVEIQADGADMIARSVEYNKLSEKITVLNEDLKNLKGKLPMGYYDLVVCNPPYKPLGTGVLNPADTYKIIRHECSCTIDDIASSASSLLRFSGRFCLCQRPERLPDVLEAFRKADLEPKKLRMVQQRKNKAPKLFLIEGRRGGKKGGLVNYPALLIEDDNGNFSNEMMSIYGSYKDKVE